MMESWFKKKGMAEAYEFFRSKGSKNFWCKAIWRNFIPPKFSITLWFALDGQLKMVDKI